MTRILTITSGLGVGGAETMLVQLAQALSARGHAQQVISLSSQLDLAGLLEASGVAVRDFGLRSPGGVLPAAVKLRRIVSAFAPDVIQGWMYHGNLAASLAHAVSPARGGRRLYWALRASNMDSGRYGGLIRVGALLSRFTDAVVANSQAGATFHVAQGFSAATMRVIANGVDTAKFKPDGATRGEVRRELSLDATRPLAICVARVDPMKDHTGLLEAIAALPALDGLLVGAGTDTMPLPPNVRALGRRSDVARLYAAADIVVSSSAFGEGFSNAVAEGMSAGVVPVATDVGDTALIVGDNGMIVPPRDPGALRAALSDVATLSVDERRRRGLMARRRIVEHFSLDAAVNAFEALYRGV
jgi:glycosyltransferase involved in cell wall biosynthesis